MDNYKNALPIFTKIKLLLDGFEFFLATHVAFNVVKSAVVDRNVVLLLFCAVVPGQRRETDSSVGASE